MSYQVLARKWRPRNFATLVGQEHVVRALTDALSENRLHHAYLFTGTRGVGKTTIARILAKSLNCEAGVSASPCGACRACLEIDAGRFVDLLEVDAATNTRVDEMRQLLENAVYAPTRGRYKVYVIDEVHMLLTSAFNAMLKTLEEPPEHVKFILATTDPQKIPVTVLSRCLQFNLKQMLPTAIVDHLARILSAEDIRYETGALQLIARSASGSMRDALSLLDQAIAHGAGRVETVPVGEMLGTVGHDYLFCLLEAVACGDAATLVATAADMSARSLSLSVALAELSLLLTRLQVAQFSESSLAEDNPDRERLLAMATRFSPEFVQLAYQIVVHGRDSMHSAPDDYAGFLMTLLRLHAFRPETAEAPSTTGKGSASARLAAERVSASPPKLATPPLPAQANGVQDWHQVLTAPGISGMARELAQHCELREPSSASCRLRLPPAHKHLLLKSYQDKLQLALSEHFSRPMTVQIELGEVESDTPAIAGKREQIEKQEAAIAAIEQDTFVREVIENFDASLVETSIKPIA